MNSDTKKTSGLWAVLGRSEAGAATVIIGAAAILILPVPTWAMDVLLSLNIAFGLTMLLLAIRAGGGLKVSSFPTLLLISTLFRLALNVSTTRLILAQGDAGEVVRAFGSFVTAGNALVGGVLFAILTIVQFIVIAKGAERVAEVTARFTLDAMPGKQMSIDADLRAGVVDQAQAGLRRRELEREAQFHGSMDGAMKFVKGDAIASMVITVVNLAGGLLVGCAQRDLSAAQAADTYLSLTIGDGLVSQIPALLISLAAGLVVTRVRAEREDMGLGRQVAQQVGAHPEALMCAGGVLVLLGLAPGMPLLAFGLLGLMLIGLGCYLSRARVRALGAKASQQPKKLHSVLPLRLSLGDDQRSAPLALAAVEFSAGVGRELGVSLPPLEITSGPAGRWSLSVDHMPLSAGGLAPGEDQLPPELVLGLRRSAVHFVGVQEVQDMLDRLELEQPALIREVVPRLIPPVLLSEILTRLVEEQVPIGNLRSILGCLAEWARAEADPMVLAERVRERLGMVITSQVAPKGELSALLLDPETESQLGQAMAQDGAGGTSLALDPEMAQGILDGLESSLKKLGDLPQVVVCRPDLRRPFYKLVSSLRPLLRVVSFLELNPQVVIRPVGRVCPVSRAR